MLTPSYIGSDSELTRKGVCEQAEHVMSPQEYMRVEYDVTMKTRTNLPMLKYIGVHTKPLNGVSIRKNVSCGSFYNMKAEK